MQFDVHGTEEHNGLKTFSVKKRVWWTNSLLLDIVVILEVRNLSYRAVTHLSALSAFAIDSFLPSGLHCLNYLGRSVSDRSLSDCLIVFFVVVSVTTEFLDKMLAVKALSDGVWSGSALLAINGPSVINGSMVLLCINIMFVLKTSETV